MSTSSHVSVRKPYEASSHIQHQAREQQQQHRRTGSRRMSGPCSTATTKIAPAAWTSSASSSAPSAAAVHVPTGVVRRFQPPAPLDLSALLASKPTSPARAGAAAAPSLQHAAAVLPDSRPASPDQAHIEHEHELLLGGGGHSRAATPCTVSSSSPSPSPLASAHPGRQGQRRASSPLEMTAHKLTAKKHARFQVFAASSTEDSSSAAATPLRGLASLERVAGFRAPPSRPSSPLSRVSHEAAVAQDSSEGESTGTSAIARRREKLKVSLERASQRVLLRAVSSTHTKSDDDDAHDGEMEDDDRALVLPVCDVVAAAHVGKYGRTREWGGGRASWQLMTDQSAIGGASQEPSPPSSSIVSSESSALSTGADTSESARPDDQPAVAPVQDPIIDDGDSSAWTSSSDHVERAVPDDVNLARRRYRSSSSTLFHPNIDKGEMDKREIVHVEQAKVSAGAEHTSASNTATPRPSGAPEPSATRRETKRTTGWNAPVLTSPTRSPEPLTPGISTFPWDRDLLAGLFGTTPASAQSSSPPSPPTSISPASGRTLSGSAPHGQRPPSIRRNKSAENQRAQVAASVHRPSLPQPSSTSADEAGVRALPGSSRTKKLSTSPLLSASPERLTNLSAAAATLTNATKVPAAAPTSSMATVTPVLTAASRLKFAREPTSARGGVRAAATAGYSRAVAEHTQMMLERERKINDQWERRARRKRKEHAKLNSMRLARWHEDHASDAGSLSTTDTEYDPSEESEESNASFQPSIFASQRSLSYTSLPSSRAPSVRSTSPSGAGMGAINPSGSSTKATSSSPVRGAAHTSPTRTRPRLPASRSHSADAVPQITKTVVNGKSRSADEPEASGNCSKAGNVARGRATIARPSASSGSKGNIMTLSALNALFSAQSESAIADSDSETDGHATSRPTPRQEAVPRPRMVKQA